jgi:hypothetical protein
MLEDEEDVVLFGVEDGSWRGHLPVLAALAFLRAFLHRCGGDHVPKRLALQDQERGKIFKKIGEEGVGTAPLVRTNAIVFVPAVGGYTGDMMRRRGIRRWVRWASYAAAVVLALAWGASAFGYASYYFSGSACACSIGSGLISGAIGDGAWAEETRGWDVGIFRREDRPRLIWLPIVGGSDLFELCVPLWMPWLVASGFAFWRFRADRLPGPQACLSCGYDRAGLAADAKCPDCGEVPAGG